MAFEKICYGRTTANLACSILKEFGVEPKHETLKEADELLAGGFENVVLILLDAMGMSVLEKNLPEDSFLRKEVKAEYQSVFLSTTVASTTSIMSGLYPAEHCWLGWDCYYPEIDKNVTTFFGTETETGEKAADFHPAFTLRPYKSVKEQIEEAGGEAHLIATFAPPFPDSFEKEAESIKELCGRKGKKFIYCYFDQPDGTMHKTGVTSEESREVLKGLSDSVEKLCAELAQMSSESGSKTLVLVTADHGHMDPKPLCLLDYPDVLECLKRGPSLEPRAVNFFVKAECKEKFPEIFNGHFGGEFKLLTKEEVLEEELFGPLGEDVSDEQRGKFTSMLGDFVAVATGESAIFFTREDAEMFKGYHGGLTPEETRIPLIGVNCGNL